MRAQSLGFRVVSREWRNFKKSIVLRVFTAYYKDPARGTVSVSASVALSMTTFICKSPAGGSLRIPYKQLSTKRPSALVSMLPHTLSSAQDSWLRVPGVPKLWPISIYIGYVDAPPSCNSGIVGIQEDPDIVTVIPCSLVPGST